LPEREEEKGSKGKGKKKRGRGARDREAFSGSRPVALKGGIKKEKRKRRGGNCSNNPRICSPKLALPILQRQGRKKGDREEKGGEKEKERDLWRPPSNATIELFRGEKLEERGRGKKRIPAESIPLRLGARDGRGKGGKQKEKKKKKREGNYDHATACPFGVQFGKGTKGVKEKKKSGKPLRTAKS